MHVPHRESRLELSRLPSYSSNHKPEKRSFLKNFAYTYFLQYLFVDLPHTNSFFPRQSENSLAYVSQNVLHKGYYFVLILVSLAYVFNIQPVRGASNKIFDSLATFLSSSSEYIAYLLLTQHFQC